MSSYQKKRKGIYVQARARTGGREVYGLASNFEEEKKKEKKRKLVMGDTLPGGPDAGQMLRIWRQLHGCQCHGFHPRGYEGWRVTPGFWKEGCKGPGLQGGLAVHPAQCHAAGGPRPTVDSSFLCLHKGSVAVGCTGGLCPGGRVAAGLVSRALRLVSRGCCEGSHCIQLGSAACSPGWLDSQAAAPAW